MVYTPAAVVRPGVCDFVRVQPADPDCSARQSAERFFNRVFGAAGVGVGYFDCDGVVAGSVDYLLGKEN